MNQENNKLKQSSILLTLRDEDIFPRTSHTDEIVWLDRLTGKVVLFNDDNEIALIGNNVNDFFLLPGGGIEPDETILAGTIRECMEETGCKIKILSELGVTEDFRNRDGRHAITYGYSAKVTSQGTQSLTENEISVGAYVKWIPLPEAVELFKKQEDRIKAGEVKFYNTCFNIFRDSLFIQLVHKQNIV